MVATFVRFTDEETPDQYEMKVIKAEPVITVGVLAKEVLPAALAVESVIQTNNYRQDIPKEMIITRFQPVGTPGAYYMHYIVPKTGQRSYRYVTNDFQLKILSGEQGDKLREELKAVTSANLGTLGRRLSCTLGTDPEVFAVDANGEVAPAWTFLPGKDKPQKFDKHRKTGTAYWDGFQAEFTTQGTDTCLLWVSDNIQGGLKTIHEAAKKVGGKLTVLNVLPVNPDVLNNEPIEHVQFGCAPSYNVYGLKGNIQDGRDVPFRFAGGHLHFGLSYAEQKTQGNVEKYVKALDMVLGVASVAMLGDLDNPIRRQFYGLPGEYRTPAHGFEYRTLSNAWLCHPLAMNMVFDLARSVCGLAEEGLLDGWQSTQEETLEIIINNDIAKAREVLDRNKAMFLQILKVITGAHYQLNEHLELAFSVWRNGIATVVEDPTDMVKNWTLEGYWVTHGDGKGKNWEKACEHIMKGEKM